MRSRLPVAAKTALATAGPIGATPGSPTPVGASDEGTSTFGISSMRPTRSAEPKLGSVPRTFVTSPFNKQI